jgi:hypothetical protein
VLIRLRPNEHSKVAQTTQSASGLPPRRGSLAVERHAHLIQLGGVALGWLLTIPLLVGLGLGSLLAGIFVAVSLFVVPPE